MDTTSPPVITPPASKADGRRERSASSRRNILTAMIQLIESGNPSPTAETVAARAGVSLRTVFRHFEEMENLHIEISAQIFGRVQPILDQPIKDRTLPNLLDEIMERRSQCFEIIAPFKKALDSSRYRSQPIEAQHRRVTVMSRELLAAALPAEIVGDKQQFEILTMLYSVETWQRLREVQGLSIAETNAAIVRACRAVCGFPPKA